MHGAGVDDRRHWHRACWGARERRASNIQRGRGAPGTEGRRVPSGPGQASRFFRTSAPPTSAASVQARQIANPAQGPYGWPCCSYTRSIREPA